MCEYYISMTTVPPRINKIKKILENFYENQTLKPHKIILNIPIKYNRFDITDNFENYILEIQNSLILKNILIINRCVDYWSASKIIPTIEYLKINDIKNVKIIIIDDDLEYVNNFIEYFDNKVNIYGDENAYCFTGYNLKKNPYKHPNFEYLNSKNIKNDIQKIDIFGGVCGVFLKDTFFNDDLFKIINDENFVNKYLLSDDDFLSLYLKIKKINIYLLKGINTVKCFNEESNDSNYCIHLDKTHIERQEKCINYMLNL
jgi:hypothetical protein